ncbi:MAG: metal ABC transporter permease [Shimia sp.]
MIDPFLARALLAATGVALAAGPLGCFVVWRRMAYFGDATAHAAVLGVAIALIADVPITGPVVAVALLMALGVQALDARGTASDSALGVLSYGALAVGLVAVSLTPNRVGLMAFLVGDVLAVSWRDVATIWIGGAVVLALLAWRWTPLLLSTLDPGLARAGGAVPEREGKVLALALALVVATAIEVVGALLIGALVLIPAAAARRWTRTPEAMARAAAAFGILSALAGIGASFVFDTPTGPTIVCAALALFAVSQARRLG